MEQCHRQWEDEEEEEEEGNSKEEEQQVDELFWSLRTALASNQLLTAVQTTLPHISCHPRRSLSRRRYKNS